MPVQTHASGYRYAPETIQNLIRGYQRGGPLPREFYVSPEVFQADMDRIWHRYWLYVGHGCMIPKPGDWLTWTIGHDSVVVVRGEDMQIRAFHNTCRHRGARICNTDSGNSRNLTCPYHAWTYALDGRLKVKTEKDFGIPESQLGLHPVKLRDAAGVLFVALGDDPVDFDAAYQDIASRMKFQGMDRAKVAKKVTYDVNANWKLVFENNRECYHCPPAHPEYIKGTFDVLRAIPSEEARVIQQTELANERFKALGIDIGDPWSSMTGAYWRAHRTPLMEGWKTQSLDGTPVAPLMGHFRDKNQWSDGTLRCTVFPNFWQHASDDHAVATRIAAVGPDQCKIDVFWLVDKDAVEGRDYDLAKLMPFWQRTSEQDWFICTANQQGVSSSKYKPGPYHKGVEGNVQHFVDWYLGEMTDKPKLRAAGL